MSTWKEMQLRNLGRVVTGKTPPTINKDNYGGEIPFICIPDLGHGKFVFKTAKTISSIGLSTVKNCVLPKGSIVVSCIATIGKVGITTKEVSITNQQINSIIPDVTKINPDFCYYWFLNLGENLSQYGGGGSIFEIISKDKFSNITIPLPQLTEQKSIAEVLSCLDDKIDLLHRQNKTLEKLAETLFTQWFIKEADADWESEPLGNYVTIKRGGSPRPIHDYISEIGLNWLKISDVTSVDSPFIFEIKEKIKVEGISKTTFLKKGSLILSNSATPGIPKILDVDSCIHDGWLHFPQSKFSKEFLYLLFKHIRPELLQMGNGSIFTNLKTDILKEYILRIPDDKALAEFDEQIKTIFEKLYSNTTQIRTVTQLRDTLLPKLMNGEAKIENI